MPELRYAGLHALSSEHFQYMYFESCSQEPHSVRVAA